MSEFTLIEAASGSGKRPKVHGLAYSGGKMALGGWKYPVVVDLSGMVIPDKVPLLTNHENKTDCRIGMISASIKDNALEITGEIYSESKEANDIVAQAKAGASWQLSIGADVKECELVKATRVVNNQSIEGTFYLVAKSELREVSVVAVGADSSTTMQIAAKFNLQGDKAMDSDKKNEVAATAAETLNDQPQETNGQIRAEHVDVSAAAEEAAQNAVIAERKRVSEIQKICGGEFPEIEKNAINAGFSLEKTRDEVLAAYRKNKPHTDINVIVKNDTNDAKTLEAAFALRAGISEATALNAYGEKTIEAAMPDMDMSIRELMVRCARLDGIEVGRMNSNDSIRAAFSSVSLPNILSNVANKRLLDSFNETPVIATKICATGDINDFKETERLRLTDVGDLLPVAADGEIKDGGLVEESAKNQLDTYGKKFCLTRKMIINDDLGAFMKVPTNMGNRAARLIDQLFFQRLLSNPTQGDGSALFHTNHHNIQTGATSVLSKDALQSAIKIFMDQVDADGQPISVEAKYLLVPTALKFSAIELTQGAALIASGETDVLRPALNAIVDERLQVVSSPYLANSNYTGNSSTAWYLFGDPKQVETFEIGFLKGKRTPTVERGETDFNTLGIWFRVYFDLGVREQGFRGMVKSTGN